MEKIKSLKIKPWNRKDVAKVSLTYVLNVAVFMALFFLFAYIKADDISAFNEVTKNWHGIFTIFAITLFSTVAMFLYFFFEERDFLKNPANSEMLFLILQISLALCFITERYVSVYVRPLAFVAIITLFLTNSKTSIFTSFIFTTILLGFDGFTEASAGATLSVQAFLPMLSLTSGVLAVYLLREVYSRFKMICLSVIFSLPCLLIVAFSLINNSFLSVYKDLIAAACSGPLAITAFVIILPIFEFIFKKLTCFKLAELTDHKARFIKKMIVNSPGTFNHAIVVSNLAEACATAIGEDALLARTCAYYHDIGKLRRPEFFKENQGDGKNPHDDITPELSANIIKSHTVDGHQFLLKNRLPKEVADIAREHHGTMPILYFYDKAKKFTDGEVSIAQYSYSGPKPQTKIASIIMIVDSCEALARTMTDRSRASVEKAVRKIVNERMQLGQFDECEITIKELNIIIHTVINSLSGVYHSRIEYPKVSLEGVDPDSLEMPDKETE